MKKKRQNVASPPPTSTAAGDVKSLIHDYALFFDKLVELIPAKFYLPNDDANDAKPWFQGLSKAAKASAKQQTRDNIKKARRDRLDPEKSSTTTLDLLKQSIIQNENKPDTSKKTIIDSDDDEDDDEDENQIDIKPIKDLDDSGGNRSVTYEELQQRLHSKLEELRANRGQGKRSTYERRDSNPHKKRKRDDEFGERSGGESNLGKSDEVDIEKHVEEATKGIEFGKVKIATDDDGSKKKKMKGSKAQELERAKRLLEAKKDPEKGEVVSKKHSWKAAVSRAAGIKVHDDPRILKQSIHKEKKRHEKNAGKWKERIETREKMKGEKQQKRSENIAGRIQEKKMRKIAKREKKLMRPGFEGRKEGYINQN